MEVGCNRSRPGARDKGTVKYTHVSLGPSSPQVPPGYDTRRLDHPVSEGSTTTTIISRIRAPHPTPNYVLFQLRPRDRTSSRVRRTVGPSTVGRPRTPTYPLRVPKKSVSLSKSRTTTGNDQNPGTRSGERKTTTRSQRRRYSSSTTTLGGWVGEMGRVVPSSARS